ncbi:MAG: response regulator transcription factor [Oscillochloris sp.]|nr:response regulator transcription factor [Oscillochloris sp.]
MIPQATILIVDDQPELLMGIQMALEAAGYTVLTAPDGHIAIELLNSEAIDLILADIAMPELNGYQLFDLVRSDPGLLRIPFIFLTARAMASDIRYGKSLGVDDYLTKPVKPEDLIAAVSGRLRRARELSSIVPSPLEVADDSDELLVSPRLARSSEPGLVVSAPLIPIGSPDPAVDLLKIGSLWIAPSQHRVWLKSAEIGLSAREFRVLECLARRSGQVVPPHEIVLISHGIDTDDTEASSLLRPLVRLLRRRLGYAVGEMGCIENVRGVGYRLVAPE